MELYIRNLSLYPTELRGPNDNKCDNTRTTIAYITATLVNNFKTREISYCSGRE